MEARMRKYNQVSPERAKVWTERSPKYKEQIRRVSVLYYLCRNRQLEHPHFIEVSLSSRDGLHLRDVIDRLNGVRGTGMASMYSWSSKRSYKNGFVWHDLSEDDIILPAHGNEYVLKGCELIEQSTSGLVGNFKMHNKKELPEPESSRNHDNSSSSSCMNEKEIKHSRENDVSPRVRLSGSSGASPESKDGKSSSWGGSLSLIEYKVCKSDGITDASTQTEDTVSRHEVQETCTRGVSTDDGATERESYLNHFQHMNETSEISRDTISPLYSSTASSSDGKTDTLESLIRSNDSKINSFRILQDEDIRLPANVKPKATNVLLQLISCGSISVKDNSFGLVPSYRPRISHSKFSPLFSTSIMLGELDYLTKNPRMMSLRLEDKEYFSGSLIETNMLKKDRGGPTALKRSSSYSADRSGKLLNIDDDKEESASRRFKCIPSIKASLSSKQSRSESMRSFVSDLPRKSADGLESAPTSNGSSKRMVSDSFRKEEKVIKIEERLASGARVIIQSKAPGNMAAGSC